VYGAVAGIAILVVLVIVRENRVRSEAATQLEAPEVSVPTGESENGHPLLGYADAPVTITLYEDYSCSNCKFFFENVEPALLEDYIVPGKVRLEVYPMAFISVQSAPAAEAAACANEQEGFWEYRQLLFSNQGVLGFSRQNLLSIAEAAGLDRQAFAMCFDSARYRQAIYDQTRTAYQFGIQGTPTLIIRGQRYEGVLPYDSSDEELPGLKQIIEAILAGEGS
jgi:protein-disulfide isomerase